MYAFPARFLLMDYLKFLRKETRGTQEHIYTCKFQSDMLHHFVLPKRLIGETWLAREIIPSGKHLFNDNSNTDYLLYIFLVIFFLVSEIQNRRLSLFFMLMMMCMVLS